MVRTRKARDITSVRHALVEKRNRLFLDKEAPIAEETFFCSECNTPFIRAGRFWSLLTAKIEAGLPIFCATKCKRKYTRRQNKKSQEFICSKCKGGFTPAEEEKVALRKKVEQNSPIFCTSLCRKRYVDTLIQEVLISNSFTASVYLTQFDISCLYPKWKVIYWPKKAKTAPIVKLQHIDSGITKAIKLSRLIMENKLQRVLLPNERVKYLDNNSCNLSPENLYIKIIKGPVLDKAAKTII